MSDADTNVYTVIVGNGVTNVTSAAVTLTVNDTAELGVWNFATTNWAGQQGQLPLVATGLQAVTAWSTNGVKIDTNLTAQLIYRDVETNVSTNYYPANIDFHTGTVVLWFNPDWSSTGAGGSGPGSGARLLDVVSTNATSTNEWWLGLSSDGTGVTFNTSSNGVATVQETGTISWTAGTWHQIVLTYGATASALYVDGSSVATGGGVTNWPGRFITSEGFAVGSDLGGGSLIKGVLADLETYNYPFSGDNVVTSFNEVETGNGSLYSIAFASRYTSNVMVMAAITGAPSESMMILVNSTNYVATNAWVPFSATPTINLGSGDGLKTVNFFFNSLSNVLTRVSKRLWLVTSPPALTLTAPGSNTVNEPVLQLQGFSPEELSSISYGISNAAGVLTNQNVLVLDRFFDTNLWQFTTNTFQAFDIGLTVGTNQITVTAEDLAGNVTTSNYTFTLDYSSKTNPPVVALYWPTNGMQISGTNFTWRGTVDDPTVTVCAQIVDTNGDTNVVSGIVERNGNFWVENLPLASGTNQLTLTVTDAAGNVSVTNIAVVQSSVTLSITSIDAITNQLTVAVSGTITSGYVVWVNGTNATVSGTSWTAAAVPVNGTGTTVIQARAFASGGSSSGGGGGTNSSLSNPGNPSPLVAFLDCEADRDSCSYITCTEYTTNNQYLENYDIGTPGAWYHYITHQQNWTSVGGGSYLSTSCANLEGDGYGLTAAPNPVFVYYTGTWDGFGNLLATAGRTTNICGAFGASEYGDDDPPPPVPAALTGTTSDADILLPYYNLVEDGSLALVESVSQNTTKYSWVQGGKQVPVQYVVALNATALNSPNAWIYQQPWEQSLEYPIWSNIPPTDITMAGSRLGSDGVTYLLVSSGTPPFDITPRTDSGVEAIQAARALVSSNTPLLDGTFVEYKVGGTNYRCAIQVTTNNTKVILPQTYVGAASPVFCVGQNIQFGLYFESESNLDVPLTYTNILNPQWDLDLFSKFYNKSNYVGPNAPYQFILDPNLLKSPTTSGWFYDVPLSTTVNFTGTLAFANGKTVRLVPHPVGYFLVYRPTIGQYTPNTPPDARINTNHIPPFLQVYPPAGFVATIVSDFVGQAGITQLVSGSRSDAPHPPANISSCLDNREFLGGHPPNVPDCLPVYVGSSWTTNNNYVRIQDGGGISCIGDTVLSNQFTDYIRFQPKEENSIFVTLATLKWYVNAEANTNSRSPESYVMIRPPSAGQDPWLTVTNIFPTWTNVVYNTK